MYDKLLLKLFEVCLYGLCLLPICLSCNLSSCFWQALTTKRCLDCLEKEGLKLIYQLEQRAALTKLLTEADQGQQDA